MGPCQRRLCDTHNHAEKAFRGQIFQQPFQCGVFPCVGDRRNGPEMWSYCIHEATGLIDVVDMQLGAALWLKRESFEEFLADESISRGVSALRHEVVVLMCDFKVTLQQQEIIRNRFRDKCIHLVFSSRASVTLAGDNFVVGSHSVRLGRVIVVDPFWLDEDLVSLRAKIQLLNFPAVSSGDRDRAFDLALNNVRRPEAPYFNRHFFIFIFAASHGKFTPITTLVTEELQKAKAVGVESWYKLLAFVRATCLDSDNVVDVSEVPKDVRDRMVGHERELILLEAKSHDSLRFIHSLFARATLFQMTHHPCHYGPPFPENILEIWNEVLKLAEDSMVPARLRKLVRAIYCTGPDGDDITFRSLTAWCIWKRRPDEFAAALLPQNKEIVEPPHGHIVVSRVYRYVAKAIALDRPVHDPKNFRETYVVKSIKFADDARRTVPAKRGDPLYKMTENNYGWSLLWGAKFGSEGKKGQRLDDARRVFDGLGLMKDITVAKEFNELEGKRQGEPVNPSQEEVLYLSGADKFKNRMQYWFCY